MFIFFLWLRVLNDATDHGAQWVNYAENVLIIIAIALPQSKLTHLKLDQKRWLKHEPKVLVKAKTTTGR